MKYFSLNDKNHKISFGTAVLNGLGPNKGLYFPEEIKKLPKQFFQQISSLTPTEIATQAIGQFVNGDIPPAELAGIIENTLDFDFPVKPVEEQVGVLELFHGPTLAFKDVGAKFMAGTLGYFIKKGNIPGVTVLVATSGDTGGAVARGFLKVKGIEVIILYPKGKVSEIQEKQLTTLGENITALEVDGSFDACQSMVKMAFLDSEIQQHRKLTSANSINVARWLPQMFYYFLAYEQVKNRDQKLAFSVPSGNFGNICAGLLAKQLGLPIDHFVAANNENNVVTRFLQTQKYEPTASVQTISNAMDVGDPSNFIRILELFSNNFEDLKSHLSSFSYTDDQTREIVKKVFEDTGYLMDPHGAVGYLGLKEFLQEHKDYYGIFLETAHPVKFLETIEDVIGKKIQLPPDTEALKHREKKAVQISDYEDLKNFLLK
jgi:threonine synthase